MGFENLLDYILSNFIFVVCIVLYNARETICLTRGRDFVIHYLTSRDTAPLMSLLSAKLQTSSPSSSSSVLISCFNPSMHSSSEALALPVTPAILHALLKLFMASSNPVLVSWTVCMGALHSEKKTSN